MADFAAADAVCGACLLEGEAAFEGEEEAREEGRGEWTGRGKRLREGEVAVFCFGGEVYLG